MGTCSWSNVTTSHPVANALQRGEISVVADDDIANDLRGRLVRALRQQPELDAKGDACLVGHAGKLPAADHPDRGNPDELGHVREANSPASTHTPPPPATAGERGGRPLHLLGSCIGLPSPAMKGGKVSGELADLPATFTYADARRHGISDRRLATLVRREDIERIGRGVYHRTDAELADIDLLEVAHRAPRATLCLVSALARFDLTDQIPAQIDIALPRGQWRPKMTAPVSWHAFNPRTFDLGRESLEIDTESAIGIYSPDRTIVDSFRLRHQEGRDVAYEALRRWLRRRGSRPATLLSMARNFPGTLAPLVGALEVLQ